MKKFVQQIAQRFIEGITGTDGKGSERRIATAITLPCVLFCYVFVCVWTKQINEVVTGELLAYIGWNGYRTYKEKKVMHTAKKEPIIEPTEPVKEGGL